MRKSGLMRHSMRWAMRRVRLALCLLAALGQMLGPVPVTGGRIAAATLIAVVSLIADASPAEARRGGGSGGYSRPSSGGGSGSRTPSVSNYGSGSGGSGGYARPSTPRQDAGPVRTPSVSGTDRAIARNQSGDALNAWRAQQAPPPRPAPAPQPAAPSRPVYDGAQRPSQPTYVPRQNYSSRYSGGAGANYQSYQARFPGMPDRFGGWPTGFLIGMLVGAVASPANAAFFHHHANDPGVRSFIDRARGEPGLSDPLGNLDRALAPYAGQSRDPNYLPPGVDAGSIAADHPAPKPSESGGGGFGGFLVILLILAALGLVGFGIWRWWTKRSQGAGMRGGGVNQAARIIGRKFEKDPYRPAYVRVGMVVTLDPTPFLLLGRSGGVAPPTEATVSVAAISRLEAGQAPLTRLYLAKGGAFIELAFTASGEPERARYFDKIDEVHPSSPDEWRFWLDDADGMIGWPEFELKDGTKFARVFGAGTGARIAPLRWTETREGADGQAQQRRLSAMLYARPTNAPDPAPQWDYLLVAAAEAGRGAWVELHRGIDLNPASLKLA